MVNDTIDGTDCISVVGARVNNLKNVDIDIPHNKLTVITGLSGSGKSSLAFDTIFAEGQRRYIETFSAYARNMLGNLERPDVDHIGGLCPVIAIEQKTINRNPRSTIGTTTEIYDFLRLLYARAGHARSYLSGEEMVKYTDEKIVELILQKYDGRKIYILAPLVKNRKGHYRELFEQLVRKGFLNVRVDGELKEISGGMRLDRYKNHSIELVIDRLKVSAKRRRKTPRLSGKRTHPRRQGADGIRCGGRHRRILQPGADGPFDRHIIPRPRPAQFFIQLPAGRMPALQRPRICQPDRPRQNGAGRKSFDSGRSARAAGQI